MPVEAAEVSDSAKAKADSKKTVVGLPALSMPTLLADFAAPTPDEAELPTIPERRLAAASRPTKLQERAFDPLGVDPLKTVAMQSADRRGEIRARLPEDAGFFFFSFV